MKVKFYLLPLVLFLFMRTSGQDCSSLAFTYTTTESRCVATGSITINVTGGSGNYNFKAIGPVSTPITSSNVITGLAPGSYTVVVKDLNSGCTTQQDNIQVSGSYNDPRFQLVKTNVSCAGNDGTISVANLQNGRSPFIYTVIAPSPSSVGATNATGSFSGLVAGEYAIQLTDSCGGIQVRRITIENYTWWFDSVSVVRAGCTMANAYIRLRDNRGNTNISGTAFAGFQYGFTLNPGDTTWNATNSFSVPLGSSRKLTLVAKDNCGNVHSTVWFLADNLKPSLGPVNLTNLVCSGFTASVSGQNLTSPNFCLYSNSGTLISCNSNGIFSNLPYGSYCLEVNDACYDTTITRCFTSTRAVPYVASTVNISNKNCATFSATITGQSNLTSPDYCLYDASDVQIACNATGVFDNVPYGSYCIKVHDACTDTVINRCFTVTKPVPTLTGYTITGSGCSSFNVQVSGTNLNGPEYCLYDNNGNVITCNSTGIFDNLPYGSYCVSATSCGDVTNSICFTGTRPVPAVAAAVQITQRTCATFSAAITGQTNLSSPQYCLYDNNDVLISCNTTGVFDNVSYGAYCIKVRNNSSCYDTTISRCFTELRPTPSVSATMQLLSTNCIGVTFKVNGTNLTSPTYCLYDASDNLLECNSSGTFSNYTYGQYCVTVHDGCVDTTMKVCQTFAPVRGITLTTSKSCTINSTYIDVLFANGNGPYTINVYHLSGSLAYSNTTSSNPFRIELPALPTGAQYKVVGIDNCGNKDSATIVPDANIVSKSTTVRGKCPSSVWLNGSGDILAAPSSNYYGVTPQIIKKNGSAFTQSYSSLSGGTYTFVDLEPAQYVVEYTQANCNGKIYDTVTVSPYAYPSQAQSAVYQCDNNGFGLNADVEGGVSPYSFQIIGSTPSTPSIESTPQSEPTFNINNGTIYSLIRLRTVDACGNATLNDVSVLPLQNISVRASDSCFYQNITLSVDTIPNATYSWYRKTTPEDSVLVYSGVSYNLPFFVPEQTGLYVCKVNVNNGCLTRQSSFNLTGNCFTVLPTSFQLNGGKAGTANQLFWNNSNEKGVIRYVIERKQPNEKQFSAIGTVPVQSSNNYSYKDDNYGSGQVQYRLKVVYSNKNEFTNTVILNGGLKNEISVYPNPVKGTFTVSLRAEKPTDFKIELIGANGQLIYAATAKSITSSTLTYTRDNNIKAGIYLVRITDQATGKAEIRKLVFE